MHYYKFNISDWALSTSHLTEIEELVYFRLVNHYYDTEQPIPLKTESVIRRLRLANHSETVGLILSEFFEETKKGFVHARCEKDIKEFHKKAERNRKNGKKGGRPQKQKAVEETEEKPSGLIVGCQEEPKHNLNHKPLTTNHKPLTNNIELSKDNLCPHKDIVSLYHSLLPSLSKVKTWTSKRQGYLRTVWNEDPKRQSMDYWEKYFNYVKQSDFLMGRANDFRADLEWLVKPSNFIKVIEGKYENK